MAEVDLQVGTLAPEFKLASNENREIALSDFRGKKVVLFFVREFV